MYAPQDGHKLGQFHLADTCQLVEHLLLLELQLRLVGQILPFTATAHTEMFTEGYRAYLTIFYKPHHFALGKGVLLPSDLYVADITRLVTPSRSGNGFLFLPII